MPITYRNPRDRAEFPDWPLGGSKRGHCRFFVEKDPRRGERVGKVTTGKPKYTTYAPKWAIVDGDDGRTYLVCATPYGAVLVKKHDFMIHEYISSDDPRAQEVGALLNSVRSEPITQE